MNKPSLPKPQRKLTSLELSAPARGTLCRLKDSLGISFTRCVERGLELLAADLLPDPMPDATRAKLGLPTGPRRANRKKGVVL